MSRLNKFTETAQQVLIIARDEAQYLKHRTIGPEHMLRAILKLHEPSIDYVFMTSHISTTQVSQALEFVIGHGTSTQTPTLSTTSRLVISWAEEEAEKMKSPHIGIEHIFLGILSPHGGVAGGVLESFGIFLDSSREYMMLFSSGGRSSSVYNSKHNEYKGKQHKTPALDQVGRDITEAALNGLLDPLIGRQNELERTMQILTRRTKNNPVLLGASGVGKTAIAEGLAQRIIDGQVPESLQHARVVSLDVGLLAVGTKYRGDFEERLKSIMQEIVEAKNIIIVIDELHTLVGTGVTEGSLDAANLFKPMLARGEFQCIGATTLDDYRKVIEADPALERRFQPVQVPETNTEETLKILEGLRSKYSGFHHVQIPDETLKAAIDLSNKYIQNRYQPDKSIDLLDEAAARVHIRGALLSEEMRLVQENLHTVQGMHEAALAVHDTLLIEQQKVEEEKLQKKLQEIQTRRKLVEKEANPTVQPENIAEIVGQWTGIPTLQLTGEDAKRYLHLEETLQEKIIGQDEAVRAVARAMRRSGTQFKDEHRPIGSFIFVGPSGVGKTELAKELTLTMFGDEQAMLRLDMSEFMESHNVSRLVGSPPGYVGHDQAGQLTEFVKRRPYSVILFDEMEKAHAKVLDILLQILDDGRLTDTRGNSVSFKNTVIILTSNIGTGQLYHQSLGFSNKGNEKQKAQHDSMKKHILPALKEFLRPELLNRIDETIVFHALSEADLLHIVNIMIEQTRQRLLLKSISMHVTEEARKLLVRKGYDKENGARPLRRTVQNMLEDMLAEAILQKKLSAGDIVEINVQSEALHMHIPALIHNKD